MTVTAGIPVRNGSNNNNNNNVRNGSLYVTVYLISRRRRRPVIECFPTRTIFDINSDFTEAYSDEKTVPVAWLD